MSRRKRFWKSFKRKTRLFSPSKRSREPDETALSDGVMSPEHTNSHPNLSYKSWSRREVNEEVTKAPTPTPLQREVDDESSEDDISVAKTLQARLAEAQNTDILTVERTQSIAPIIRMSDGTPYLANARSMDAFTDRDKRAIDDTGIAVVQSRDHTDSEPTHQTTKTTHLEHPFYMLEVVLHEGKDLVVRDYSGTSDPYVKLKIASKTVYKSQIIYKSLNPTWEERVVLPILDVLKPVQFRVYDYDRGFHDDPMGGADLDLTKLQINIAENLKLQLCQTDPKAKDKDEYMGYLMATCTLLPKTQDDKEHMLMMEAGSDSDDIVSVTLRRSRADQADVDVFHCSFYIAAKINSKKGAKLSEVNKKLKMQIWSGIVSIVLVEGRNLLPMDGNGLSDPYVKFKLGSEKYRSKHKNKTLSPRWLEQFDLRLFDESDQNLEIAVYDRDSAHKDDFMGRMTIDLSTMEKERTHTIDKALEDGAGHVKILLTLTGTQGTETITDLTNYTPNPHDREDVIRKYGLMNSLNTLRDVGWLQVKVFQAHNLASADFSGKSDPFCVLELVNARLQTQTEYKTLNPEWNKIFTFNVKDIHSVLEITVYDEDRDKSFEFLGKIDFPLLRIKNGERRWYTLKDKKLIQKSKGSIQLEFDFIFNPVKAAIRTVNPQEEKYMQPEPKFKIPVMKRNIERVSQIASSIMESGKFVNSCFQWESKSRSATAFVVFLVIVWCFEIYMLPCTLLLLFLKNFMVTSMMGNTRSEPSTEGDYADDDDEEDDDEKDKEGRKSIRSKLASIQEVCLQVQQAMDAIASIGERVKNTFNWTVPWLSMLAVIALSAVALVLYMVPLRYLIMAWGVNKFTKKLRAPNAIPNNELLDFLSRVPSDYELEMYKELEPDLPTVSKKKKL